MGMYKLFPFSFLYLSCILFSSLAMFSPFGSVFVLLPIQCSHFQPLHQAIFLLFLPVLRSPNGLTDSSLGEHHQSLCLSLLVREAWRALCAQLSRQSSLQLPFGRADMSLPPPFPSFHGCVSVGVTNPMWLSVTCGMGTLG